MKQDQRLIKLTDKIILHADRVLGQGQFGRVFEGQNNQTGEIIAIKQIYKECLTKEKELIERQRSILEELKKKKHPNIMNYLGFVEANGTVYFLMDLYKNNLDSFISSSKRIPEYTVLKWFRQILEGLVFLNSHSILHRDLKPQNLLVDQYQNIKIADFGLAKHDEVVNTLGTGTPLYKAPEVYTEINYDERCDVWSVGLILYQMLAGRSLFEGVYTVAQLRHKHRLMRNGQFKIIIPPQQIQIDKVWVEIISKMLTYDFYKRNTASQILKEFKKIYKDLEERIKKSVSYIDFDLGESIKNPKKNQSAISVEDKKELPVLKQDESAITLKRIKNWIQFKFKTNCLYSKIKIHAHPKVKRNGKSLSNQYIYSLVFLAHNIQYHKHKSIYDQLKNQQIQLPSKTKIYGRQLHPSHQQQFQDLIKESTSQLKDILLQLQKQMTSIAKKFEEYKKRPQKQVTMKTKYSRIVKLTQEFKRLGNRGMQEQQQIAKDYMLMIMMDDFKVTFEQISKMQVEQLRSLYMQLIILHLYEYIDINYYDSPQYFINKKQKIETQSKQQMLQQVKKWVQ